MLHATYCMYLPCKCTNVSLALPRAHVKLRRHIIHTCYQASIRIYSMYILLMQQIHANTYTLINIMLCTLHAIHTVPPHSFPSDEVLESVDGDLGVDGVEEGAQ